MPCRLFCLRRPLAMRLSMVGRGALCSAMVKVAQQLRGGRGTSRPKAVSHGFTHEDQVLVQVSCFAAPVSTAGGTGPSTTFEQPQVGLYREVTASMTDLRSAEQFTRVVWSRCACALVRAIAVGAPARFGRAIRFVSASEARTDERGRWRANGANQAMWLGMAPRRRTRGHGGVYAGPASRPRVEARRGVFEM